MPARQPALLPQLVLRDVNQFFVGENLEERRVHGGEVASNQKRALQEAPQAEVTAGFRHTESSVPDLRREVARNQCVWIRF